MKVGILLQDRNDLKDENNEDKANTAFDLFA